MSALTFAVLQTATYWHDAAANRELFSGLMDTAQERIDVYVLPEMFSSGFTMAPEEVAEPEDGPTVRWMQQQAAARDAVVCGSLATAVDGFFVNRFVWAAPDGALTHYDKRHCFRMAGEQNHYQPGESATSIELRGLRVFPSVCYDLRFPVWLRAAASHDVLLVVANWPAVRAATWRTLLQARAIENQCYVIGANILGEDGNGVAYCGDSLLVGPDGAIEIDASDQRGLFVMRVDPAEVARVRESFPVWRDADSFTLTHRNSV